MISDKPSITNDDSNSDSRVCPEYGMNTILGMPGGCDATCENCGHKDPCCYD